MVVLLVASTFVAGCSAMSLPHVPAISSIFGPPGTEVGIASWYGDEFHGQRTASGESFDENGLTAAHPDHEFGTALRVTNLDNGRSVVVRVNDRGPHVAGRVIDLSKAAARRLGFTRAGTARVRIERVPG